MLGVGIGEDVNAGNHQTVDKQKRRLHGNPWVGNDYVPLADAIPKLDFSRALGVAFVANQLGVP